MDAVAAQEFLPTNDTTVAATVLWVLGKYTIVKPSLP